MKNLAPLTLLLVLVAGSYAHASAQGFGVEKKNPPALAGSESFTSIEGRFTVALPRQISGFSPVSFDTPQGRVTAGDSYYWRLEGAQFEIGYMDVPSAPASADDARAKLRKGADAIIASAVSKGGTLVSRSDISLAGNVGHEIKVETPQLFILARFFSVGRRVYQLTAVSKKDPQLQESATKALDSFRVLSAAEVEIGRAHV